MLWRKLITFSNFKIIHWPSLLEKLGKERIYFFMGYGLSLRDAGAGVQGENLDSGIEPETMEECYLLTCSRGFA